MIDERLRELERRYQQSGDPHDEARLVRARARAGALPEGCVPLADRIADGSLRRDRLELAAYLGHPPALALAPEVIERVSYLGHVPALRVLLGDPVTEPDVRAWASLLPAFGGLEAVARALIALTRAHLAVMARFEFYDLTRDRWAVENSVGAIRNVLDAAERTLREGGPAPIELDGHTSYYDDIAWLAYRAHDVAVTMANDPDADREEWADWLVFDRSAAAIPAARVPAITREALLPWALGETTA